jgi:hypothetical protein
MHRWQGKVTSLRETVGITMATLKVKNANQVRNPSGIALRIRGIIMLDVVLITESVRGLQQDGQNAGNSKQGQLETTLLSQNTILRRKGTHARLAGLRDFAIKRTFTPHMALAK